MGKRSVGLTGLAMIGVGALLATGLAGPARAADSLWRRVPVSGWSAPAGLSAMAARTGGDIWAVGHESGAANRPENGKPLALHSDGHGWRRTPMPDVPWTGDLTSVAAAGAASAWATGKDDAGGAHLLRWDGTRWAEAAVPGAADGATAAKVAAGPSGETWLVTGGTPGTGLLRRVGDAWKAVPLPPSHPGVSGVRVLGPGHVWLTGSVSSGQFTDAYAARWDGTSWHELPAYDGDFYAGFVDVAAVADDDVWAVGNGRGIGTVSPVVPVLAHWNGTAWSETPITWIAPPSGPNVGSVTSLATDDRNRPAWIGIGDTYAAPPDAAAYARFEGDRWVERYGPADAWRSTPVAYVAHAPGTAGYWSAGGAVPRDGNGLEPRIERTD